MKSGDGHLEEQHADDASETLAISSMCGKGALVPTYRTHCKSHCRVIYLDMAFLSAQRTKVRYCFNRSVFVQHFPMVFHIQVTAGTSPRRRAVIRIVDRYNKKHPEIPNKSDETETSFVEWQYLLLNSTFTICPGGHNAETFRLWEALEAGYVLLPRANRRLFGLLLNA